MSTSRQTQCQSHTSDQRSERVGKVLLNDKSLTGRFDLKMKEVHHVITSSLSIYLCFI